MIKLAWRLDPGPQAGVLASVESYKTETIRVMNAHISAHISAETKAQVETFLQRRGGTKARLVEGNNR